jgi:hypothetical protein
MTNEPENDFHFEQAERVMRCLHLIRDNANSDYIARETQLDGRFVLALMCLTAMEGA